MRNKKEAILRSALYKLLADSGAYLQIEPFQYDETLCIVAIESAWITLTSEEAAALQAIWDESRMKKGSKVS